jgi:DNA-binding transcriptional LysR family regulator
MNDLETRELVHFVTVAEELHFGRAAERLRIAQSALSKSIQRLESRLGVRLLDRTSRRVALTEAGTALLTAGRTALAAVRAAATSAQDAVTSRPVRLVMKPGGDGNLLSRILAAYAQTPGAQQVDIVFGRQIDCAGYLREGRADVALLYASASDLTGLAVETLLVEGRVAVLPDTHPLAGRESICLSELEAESLAQWRGQGLANAGPEVADIGELVPLVRIGRAAAILPASLIDPAPPGTVLVPVSDAEPSRIVLARRNDDHRPAVASLVSAAVDGTQASAAAR